MWKSIDWLKKPVCNKKLTALFIKTVSAQTDRKSPKPTEDSCYWNHFHIKPAAFAFLFSNYLHYSELGGQMKTNTLRVYFQNKSPTCSRKSLDLTSWWFCNVSITSLPEFICVLGRPLGFIFFPSAVEGRRLISCFYLENKGSVFHDCCACLGSKQLWGARRRRTRPHISFTSNHTFSIRLTDTSLPVRAQQFNVRLVLLQQTCWLFTFNTPFWRKTQKLQ